MCIAVGAVNRVQLQCTLHRTSDSLKSSFLLLAWISLSRPVIFGFCHSVSSGRRFEPSFTYISSTVKVELSVVKEFSCLSYVLLVVSCFLLVV